MVANLEVDRPSAESAPGVRHAGRRLSVGRAAADDRGAIDLHHRIRVDVHVELVPSLDRNVDPARDVGEEALAPPWPSGRFAELETPRRSRIDHPAGSAPREAGPHGEARPRGREDRRERDQGHEDGRRRHCQHEAPADARHAARQARRSGRGQEASRGQSQPPHGDREARPGEVLVKRLGPPRQERRPDLDDEGQQQKQGGQPGPDLLGAERRRRPLTERWRQGNGGISRPGADSTLTSSRAAAHERERDVRNVGAGGHSDEARPRHRARDRFHRVWVRRGGDRQVREVPERRVPRPRPPLVEGEVVDDQAPARREVRVGASEEVMQHLGAVRS